jgi:hypothetical protein
VQRQAPPVRLQNVGVALANGRLEQIGAQGLDQLREAVVVGLYLTTAAERDSDILTDEFIARHTHRGTHRRRDPLQDVVDARDDQYQVILGRWPQARIPGHTHRAQVAK